MFKIRQKPIDLVYFPRAQHVLHLLVAGQFRRASRQGHRSATNNKVQLVAISECVADWYSLYIAAYCADTLGEFRGPTRYCFPDLCASVIVLARFGASKLAGIAL